MSQNVDFCAFDKEHVSDNVKYKTKEKYAKKVFIWLAMSSKDISQHLFLVLGMVQSLSPTFILINV